MDTSRQVARALIDSGAITFALIDPLPIASGLVSPVSLNVKVLPYHPAEWKVIIDAAGEMIAAPSLSPERIAGPEEAALFHAILGFATGTPSIALQSRTKERLRDRVAGRKTLLVEDFLVTGTSSIESIYRLQKDEALVTDMLVILSCDFPEARGPLQKENVTLHTLTTFPELLEEAVKAGALNEEESSDIEQWRQNPYFWLSTSV